LPGVDGGEYGPFCIDGPSVALTGTPVGGIWSGIGVSGTDFNPAAGTQTIVYEYTDPVTGCTGYDSVTIIVNELPVIDPGAYGPYCIADSVITLMGTPAGGEWFGMGVSGETFDLSAGTQNIGYTWIDPSTGCTDTAYVTIQVDNLPVVDPGTYGPICEGDDIFTLNGTPSGGAWVGMGVSGDQFDPTFGSQLIRYIYTDPLTG